MIKNILRGLLCLMILGFMACQESYIADDDVENDAVDSTSSSQDDPLDETLNPLINLNRSINALAQKSLPATVTIDVEGLRIRLNRSNALEVSRKWSGSGFVISADGYLISNSHVSEGGSQFYVTFKGDDTIYRATFIIANAALDLAILKLEGVSNLAYLDLEDAGITQVGDIVLAIGNLATESDTLTMGTVSFPKRKIDEFPVEVIQSDVVINSGSSGGALLNVHGKVIGVNTAILTTIAGGYVGISYSIPVENVRGLIEEYEVTKHSQWIGMTLKEATKRDIQVLIVSVVPESVAEAAGIQENDIVTSLNGRSVDNFEDFFEELERLKRDKSLIYLGVERVSEPLILDPNDIDNKDGLIGLWLGRVSSNRTETYVDNVLNGSPVHRSGLRSNDLILTVNGSNVEYIYQFARTTMKLNEGDPIRIQYQRDQEVFVTHFNLGRRSGRIIN